MGTERVATLFCSLTLDTLEHTITRRHALEYFSMVRRSECCASRLSESTSFSTSTLYDAFCFSFSPVLSQPRETR